MGDGMYTKSEKGYLIDAKDGSRLEFQYNPGDISDSKSASYAAVAVPGISHPRYQYVTGGPRRIEFTVQFFKGNVKGNVGWLRHRLYPEHQGTMLQSAPHKLVLIFGSLYPSLTCLLREAKARYFGMFEPATLLPQQAEVKVVLEEFIEESVNHGSAI